MSETEREQDAGAPEDPPRAAWLTLMGCGPCGQGGEKRTLEPYVQKTLTPGATPRFFLLCPGCGRGMRIVAKALHTVAWKPREEEV